MLLDCYSLDAQFSLPIVLTNRKIIQIGNARKKFIQLQIFLWFCCNTISMNTIRLDHKYYRTL